MKAKILFITTIFALLLLATNSFAQSTQPQFINFNKVTAEFHGSWQWGAEQFKEYSFDELKNEDFSLDLDDADERQIKVIYGLGDVGNVYEINAQMSLSGGTDVVFIVAKNGQICKQQTETLPQISTKLIDYSRECGIKFGAEWETLAFETDVQIHNIELAQREKNEIKNAFLRKSNAGSLNLLAGQIQQIDEIIRVIDTENPNDFQAVSPDGFLKVFAKNPIGFNEEDTTFKNRLLAITKNKLIKKVILLNSEVFENLLAFQPTSQMSIQEFKTPAQLASALNDSTKFSQITGRDAEEAGFIPEWLGPTAVPYATAVGGTATAFYVTGATAIVTPGGLVLSSGSAGSSLIAAATNPIGLIIATGAVTIGGSTWYLTETDLTAFDNIIVNWDEDFFSASEQKINFILYRDDEITPTQQPPTGVFGNVKIPLTNFVQAIKTKFADVDIVSYQRLVNNPIEGLRTGLKVYKSNEQGHLVGDLSPLEVTVTAEGEDTLVIYPLEKGQIYAFTVEFIEPFPTDHPPITAIFRVVEVE